MFAHVARSLFVNDPHDMTQHARTVSPHSVVPRAFVDSPTTQIGSNRVHLKRREMPRSQQTIRWRIEEASHVVGCFVPRPLLSRATLVPQLLSRLEEHDARGPRSAPRASSSLWRLPLSVTHHEPRSDAFRVINTDRNLSGMMFDVLVLGQIQEIGQCHVVLWCCERLLDTGCPGNLDR